MRTFAPHITVARIRKRIHDNNLDKLTDGIQALEGMSFPVDKFYLYSSELTPQGAIHTKEAKSKSLG